MSRTRAFVAILALVLIGAAVAGVLYWRATARPPNDSQRGIVSQQIANAEVTVDYNRPVARGRQIYGRLVPFDTVWSPGADRPTTIAFSRAVQINGMTIAEGRYSLWAIPEPDTWTIIFSRSTDASLSAYPQGQDVLRVTATPRRGAHMETLAFYFPVVDGRGAELVLHWGNTVVPVQMSVP